MDDQGTWLTYAETGRRFGISHHAARALAKRRGWQRRTPNRPNDPACVLVPLDADVQPRSPARSPIIGERPPSAQPPANGSDRANESGTIRLIEMAIAALTAQLDRERERGDRLERDLADSRSALAVASGEAAALRQQLDQLRDAPLLRRVWRAIRGRLE